VIPNQRRKEKKGLLLHYMGAECYDIYETFKNEEDDNSAVKTKIKMNDYFVPKYNSEFERYIFRQTSQKESDNLDQFCTRLKQYTFSAEHAHSTLVEERAGCGSTPEASTKFCIDPDE